MRYWLAAILTLATLPAGAHHPVSRYYDNSKTVSMTGAVVEVRWENPHAYIVLAPEGRETERWAFEMLPPRTLQRAGVNEQTILPGMRVSVSGWPARDAAARAVSAHRITFANGSSIAVGSTGADTWHCDGECQYQYPGQSR